ncbi:insulinase family protein [Amphritea balenae]|uniref:Protease 3 n=1 Tax=Amphritea balenae TaxID=452629 RepID=A0A3P1SSG3_9GAMM|nr:insulinase family protein [Amphritea balenae]RRD00078.1 peptidase M16 [Amphritea balenae]GGK76376.1 peptidase M16 [Amphritea balenae]
MRYIIKSKTISYLLYLSLFMVAKVGYAAVHKSPNDHRDYLSFKLPNQMKVLVISDPTTDKAAASLDVNVGSNANPAGRQGLAHFLEHMLFLGTKKYPKAGSYQAYISENGGNHNAYTAYQNTNYFFDIKADSLAPALDRFSHFFIDPLFSKKYVDRERHAVNSEYQSKLKDDGRRGYSAGKQAMNPAHSMSQFAVGNLETLSNDDGLLRKDLTDFYQQYYSANLMSLVVLGKEPVAKLRQLVEEKFSKVENRNTRAFVEQQPLYQPLPLQQNIKTLKNFQQLTLTFPLPETDNLYQEKPLYFLSSLLGYEGKGSLFSQLKKQGWANGLSAYRSINLEHQSAFQITISLTDEGLKHYQDVVESTFSAIRLIEEQSITEALYNEEKQINALRFRFKEQSQPMNYVSALAGNLRQYPAEQVISADYLLEKYDEQLIRSFVKQLSPDNMLLTLQAQNMDTDTQDPWFHTEYSVKPIEESLLSKWRNPALSEGLTARQANPFISTDLKQKSFAQSTDKPELILQNDGHSLWYKQDNQFNLPKADFYLSIITEQANKSAKNAVLTALYTKLVKDQLNETLYDAALAGLNTRIYSHMRGLSLRISGYDEKQAELLQVVLQSMQSADFNETSFERVKELYTQELENRRKDKPYNQAIGEVYTLLMQSWSADKKLAELSLVSLDDLQAFIPQLMSETEVRMLAHGNLTADDATHMANIVSTQLPTNAVLNTPQELPVILLKKQQQLTQTLPLEHNDSAISVYFQGESSDLKTRAEYTLLSEIMAAPFYSKLRTEQQLGYVVFETALPLRKAPGLAFVVQSPNTDPLGLEKSIDTFVNQMGKQLTKMDSNQLKRFKASVISRINRKATRLSDLSEQYWQEIDRDEYSFDSRKQLTDAVSELSLSDIKKSFNKLPERRLTVRSFGQEHRKLVGKADLEQICDYEIALLKEQDQFVPEA